MKAKLANLPRIYQMNEKEDRTEEEDQKEEESEDKTDGARFEEEIEKLFTE